MIESVVALLDEVRATEPHGPGCSADGAGGALAQCICDREARITARIARGIWAALEKVRSPRELYVGLKELEQGLRRR